MSANNSVHVVGRFVADPKPRVTQSGLKLIQFTLAVKNKKNSSFISCTVFDKSADFVEKYFHKGSKAVCEGYLSTGSYTDRSGAKQYTWTVVVTDIDFGESKASSEDHANHDIDSAMEQAKETAEKKPKKTAPASSPAPAKSPEPTSASDGIDGFMAINEGLGEELPFE